MRGRLTLAGGLAAAFMLAAPAQDAAAQQRPVPSARADAAAGKGGAAQAPAPQGAAGQGTEGGAIGDTGQAAAPSAATLADLRAQLAALSASLKGLRAELNASGARGFAAAGGERAIDRMNAMERQLSRLTGETERLRNRIERVVRDGTNRVGDIEFRLCEMEEGCELGALTVSPLGEDAAAGGGGGVMSPAGAAAQAAADMPLTAAEKAAFDAASAALQGGDFARAAALFGDFARDHASSPAAAEAQYLRGAALDSAGDAPGAAAAWLSAFAAAPAGPRAPDALLGLSRVSAVGKSADAGCVYLDELTTRFAGTPQADEGARRSAAAGCAAQGDAPPGAAEGAAGEAEGGLDAAEGGAGPAEEASGAAGGAPEAAGALPAGGAAPGDGT